MLRHRLCGPSLRHPERRFLPGQDDAASTGAVPGRRRLLLGAAGPVAEGGRRGIAGAGLGPNAVAGPPEGWLVVGRRAQIFSGP